MPVVLLTHQVREKAVNEAIRRIEALESIKGTVVRLRMETLS